jgi:UDP-N-acetylmuramate dehydrogenase
VKKKTTPMDAISRAIDAIIKMQPDIAFKLNEPLKYHASFKIGGLVRAMFFPDSIACLTEIYGVLGEHGIAPLIMGNGSNILASDETHELAVINTTLLNRIELVNETEILAEAGALLSKLAAFACKHSLSGLEFAHGIPGTLGGAVAMNAGAYGGEMKDVIINTNAYNTKSGKYSLAAPEHDFSYRHSRFTDSGDIVLSSVMRLTKGDSDSVKRKMDELLARRRESQPLDLPSGGSTFKRPSEGYAAAFIEQAGLKGFTIGGAQVSKKHAGFIVNRGDATFTDVMAVIGHVRKTVFMQFGIMLELELKIVG